MGLAERVREAVCAGFAGIYVQSFEQEDALTELVELCGGQGWGFAQWDLESGLVSRADRSEQAMPTASDPLAAVRSLPELACRHETLIVVLRNFHRFLHSAEVVQALDRQVHEGKRRGTTILLLSPVVELPPELEKLFLLIDHDLPGPDQLSRIAAELATGEGEIPPEEELAQVLEASAGMTRLQAEGAYSLSLVRHGVLKAETIWEIKGAELEKSGLLSIHRGKDSFAELGGMESLKQFCRQALRSDGRRHPQARPRGLLLLSPPGCGKSQFCKSLGAETGRPTVVLDIGALMGPLVGATESNVRRALQLVDAMAPCILLVDEVEKGLSGVANSGSTDSGVSARLFGSLLTWLSDHTSDVFCVCTANDVSRLPPEFSRAERFDALYFVDLPSAAEREAIWRIHLAHFELDPSQGHPPDEGWTGAEIRSCCRLAAMLGTTLQQASQLVVPLSVTAHEQVEQLRRWASGRCLSAQSSGVYRPAADTKRSRRIRRDAELN